jgi:hypothetical protein
MRTVPLSPLVPGDPPVPLVPVGATVTPVGVDELPEVPDPEPTLDAPLPVELLPEAPEGVVPGLVLRDATLLGIAWPEAAAPPWPVPPMPPLPKRDGDSAKPRPPPDPG